MGLAGLGGAGVAAQEYYHIRQRLHKQQKTKFGQYILNIALWKLLCWHVFQMKIEIGENHSEEKQKKKTY